MDSDEKAFRLRMAAQEIPFMRKLPTGEWAGLRQFMFTYGLLVGVDDFGYRMRYCYDSLPEALGALLDWDGQGDPPGPWIKAKGRQLDGSVTDRSRRPQDQPT